MRCGAYDGLTQPEWLQGALEQGASWLDVSAAVNEEGMVSCVVVNISEEEEFKAELKGVGSGVEIFEVTGADVKAVNTKEKEGVGLREWKWDGKGTFGFKKHSMTMLRWHTGKRMSDVSIGNSGPTGTQKLVTQAEAEPSVKGMVCWILKRPR